MFNEVSAIPLVRMHWSCWAFLLAAFSAVMGIVWVAVHFGAQAVSGLVLLGIAVSLACFVGAAARARDARLNREKEYANYLAIVGVPTLLRASVSQALSGRSQRAIVEYLNEHHPGALAAEEPAP